MTNKQLEAVANLQAENAELRRKLDILQKAFAPIFFPSSFLLYGDDDKPIRQVGIEIDNYSEEVVLKNRHGGTNCGRPITKLVLDCVNAVMEAQWKYTQLSKEAL